MEENHTVMTAEEIVRDYQQAKNKQKQIKILADLNSTSPGEIKSILAAAGVEGVTAPQHPCRPGRGKGPREPELEKIPEASVYDRIETILAALPADTSDRVRGTALDMVTALFQEYIVERFNDCDKEKAKCQ